MRTAKPLLAALMLGAVLLAKVTGLHAQDAAPPAPAPVAPPMPAPSAPPVVAPAALPEPAPSAPPVTVAAPAAPPVAVSGSDTTESGAQLEPHARLMTGFALDRFHPSGGQPPRDETEQAFFLKQARVGLDARLDKRVSASFSFDLEASALRNAYVNVRLQRKALQLRAGHFKRPFTRLANRSVAAIPFKSRGLFDDAILQGQQWGDRALGAMLFGRPIKALRYYAAVMSPVALGSDIEGADLIGRVEWQPAAWLSVGAAGARKWTERFTDGPNLSLHAMAFDAALELGALQVAFEIDAAQNPSPPPIVGSTAAREPWSVSALGYGTYGFGLGSKLSLGPVAVLEWMDPDTGYSRDQRVRGVLGLLLAYRGSLLRVMPQVEVTRPTEAAGPRGEVASESYYVLVSTEI